MAIYEYFCPKCKRDFELMRPMKDADMAARCPECQGKAEKMPSVFGSTAGYGINIPSRGAYRGNNR